MNTNMTGFKWMPCFLCSRNPVRAAVNFNSQLFHMEMRRLRENRLFGNHLSTQELNQTVTSWMSRNTVKNIRVDSDNIQGVETIKELYKRSSLELGKKVSDALQPLRHKSAPSSDTIVKPANRNSPLPQKVRNLLLLLKK